MQKVSLQNNMLAFATAILLSVLSCAGTEQKFNPQSEKCYRQIEDSLLISEIKQYNLKQMQDSSLVVVYVLPNSRYAILNEVGISHIYYIPFSYFTIVDNKPVLFHDYREDCVDPAALSSNFITYLEQFLMHDIDDTVFEKQTKKRLKGNDTITITQSVPLYTGKISYDPPIWEVTVENGKVKRNQNAYYQILYRYYFLDIFRK